jgi:lipopolysaccharide biosynthesis glycosyltransferase
VILLCTLVPFKKYRQRIRSYCLRCRIRLDGSPPLPVKKRPRPINLAFGFDGGRAQVAGVALTSLLVNSQNRASYNIYCVVDASVTPEMREALAKLVKARDRDSSLTFLEANRDFDQARLSSSTWPVTWPVAVYYRLMLPVLLPELDEVIYADSDVIFRRDLLGLADLDLGDHLLAGVLDKPDYINSGLLVLDLARIRREKIYETWLEISRREYYAFADQDVLNITCRGRILYLPVKYNFCYQNYYRIYRRGVVPRQDQHDLKYNVVMVHYAGTPRKPWDGEGKLYMHDLWREYARLTPFYDDLRAGLKTGR